MPTNHRDAVDWVYANYRPLFDQNIARTCDQIVGLVLKQINDPDWGRVGKTAGEGQYRPPGWVNFEAPGSDGKLYTMTGWSHDAIKHKSGQVVDLLGQGNDSDSPIFHPDGRPMVALPQWNEVPPEHWRVNNPWVAATPIDGPVPVPQPPTPPQATQPPGREEALDELTALDAYYKAADGLQRPNGLSLGGKPDFLGIAAWYLDVYQQQRIHGKTRAEARAAYVSDIRHSDEWKQKHPGQTP